MFFISCVMEPSIKVSLLKNSESISSVSIPWLSRQGGEELIITGNFDTLKNPVIKIDGHNCEQAKKLSPTQLSCVTPANSKIKNVTLEIIRFNKVVSTFPLKYVGVLGQASTKSVIQKARGLNLPVMVKVIDSKLYIGDFGNRRVVGFKNTTNISNKDYDFSLKSSNLNQDFGKVWPTTGNFLARELDYKNGLFMFADGENHRVLIFDGIPSVNQKPRVILGQPDYESTLVNNGGLSAKSLNKPMYAKFIDGKIFVSDSLNNRILVWNSLPTSNFQNADYVLGQPDFTTNTSGLSANSFNYPIGIDKIGNKFFLSDYQNRRLLIWNSTPSANVPADQVMGQADFTTASNIASAHTFVGPIGFKLVGNKFFVVDSSANRILVYKNFDLENPNFSALNADIVLGQPDFLTSTVWKVSSKITAQSLSEPSNLEIFEGKLYVSDTYHNRVLVYNHIPDHILNDQNLAADEVIGQESFSTSGTNRTVFGANFISRPSAVAIHDGKLFINSEDKGKINVWSSIPEDDFSPADFVLGQDGFTSNDIYKNKGNLLCTASSLSSTYDMLSYNNKLIVSDVENHRVLIWNNINGTNSQPADIVLGQIDLDTNTADPVSASTLRTPIGMNVIDNKLVVADRGNHRLLIYDNVPIANNAAADVVVGQNNFSDHSPFSSTPFPHIINGKNFYSPFNSTIWLGKFLVADHNSRRVLLWNSFEDFNNGEEAVSVWGQEDLTTYGGVSSIGINKSSTYTTVRVIDDVLYVLDPFNNRILEFKNLPFGIHLVPTGVIGQKDFISNNYINENIFSAYSLNLPTGIYSIENRIYITDYLNDRVLILPK